MKNSISRRDWIRKTAIATLGTAVLPRLNLGYGQTSGSIAPQYPELKLINLAGNENPYGPSRNVSMAIMKEISNSCRYPFREETILTDLIAQKEGVEPENIVLGNGCDEILSAAGYSYGKKGANIIATQPTYLQLMEKAEQRGASIKWINHTSEMKHDLDAMRAAVDEYTSIIYICNPDTPTGTMRSQESIERFCRDVTPRAPVFLDEVYLDFLDDFEKHTQVELVRQGLPVIIGRSFSKMHGLAGHRIGYAIAPKEIAERISHEKTSSPNYLGVIAAIASIRDSSFHRLSASKIKEGRQKFCALLDKLQLTYTPSVGNFVFHYTGIPIREYQAEMKKRNFLVGRPFPPYDDWCRISIGNLNEMRQFESAMLEVYGSRP